MIFRVGDKIPLSVNVIDEGIPVSGLDVKVSIRRLSDNKYWDGSSWGDTETFITMNEIYEGYYEYIFDHKIAENTENIYIVTYKCDDPEYSFRVCEVIKVCDIAKLKIQMRHPI